MEFFDCAEENIMRIVVICVGLLLVSTFWVGLLFVRSNTGEVATEVLAQSHDKPRFRLLYGSASGEHANYTLQTPPEEKNFADDCIGCEQEVGNAVIFAEFGRLNKSEYLFNSNSENNSVIEKTPILDGSGKTVGEQRMVVFKEKEKTVGARLFWIEGKDFWAVQGPSVELTKALKESEQYKEIRRKVAEEIKKYVPIENANTKGKDRCADFKQRRVSH